MQWLKVSLLFRQRRNTEAELSSVVTGPYQILVDWDHTVAKSAMSSPLLIKTYSGLQGRMKEPLCLTEDMIDSEKEMNTWYRKRKFQKNRHEKMCTKRKNNWCFFATGNAVYEWKKSVNNQIAVPVYLESWNDNKTSTKIAPSYKKTHKVMDSSDQIMSM